MVGDDHFNEFDQGFFQLYGAVDKCHISVIFWIKMLAPIFLL